jgi:hypothetical protein
MGVKWTNIEDLIPNILNNTDINIIYIYRDIRDVLLSSKHRFANYKIMKYLINNKREVEKILDFDHERLLKIRFEDLILDSDITLKQLSNFLGIKITKDITFAQDRQGPKFVDNSSFQDLTKLFDKRACYRWKNHLNSKEVRYCEMLIPDFIRKTGYDISGHYLLRQKIPIYKDFCMEKSKRYVVEILRMLNKKIDVI